MTNSQWSRDKYSFAAGMSRWIFTRALFLLIPAVASSLDYSASYRATYNGLEIEAEYKLQDLGNGFYKEASHAKSVFGKIKEATEFKITNEGVIHPHHYSYKRSIMGVSKSERQSFDWKQMTVNYEKKDSTVVSTIEPGVLDIVTHKVQIRRDLMNGTRPLSYRVMKRGKLKTYDYEIIGEEVINTDLGALKTTKIRRVTNADKKRDTVVWLAKDWDYLIVKLTHDDNGEKNTLNISKGIVGGRKLIPLQSTNGDEL
ncbi:DUF3108 domain-containing protein [Porticoccaceae bacterium]|nr:DUF3108 domain-containing protein [Porticoccaceae bacterium]MDA8651598.1 DUF3108 domain-containing protein [Porticoccaceae bacterium]MDB2663671.1 DUF3108 domain-containing protein [Porticoccaceae bacterium]